MIFGSLAIIFVAGVTALAWYVLDSAQTAANKNRMAAAQAKRWPKKEGPIGDEVEFEEVNKNQNGQHQETGEETKINPS